MKVRKPKAPPRRSDRPKTSPFLTFSEAAAVAGISRFHIRRVVARMGLTVYTNRLDARKRFLKREDVVRMVTPVLICEPDPSEPCPPSFLPEFLATNEPDCSTPDCHTDGRR